MNAMAKIKLNDAATTTTTAKPKCHDMRKVVLKDGRMKDTALNPTAFQFVKDNNNDAANQLEIMCEYCGIYHGMGDLCHCHKYDCKDCEPNNFCKKCDQITVTV